MIISKRNVLNVCVVQILNLKIAFVKFLLNLISSVCLKCYKKTLLHLVNCFQVNIIFAHLHGFPPKYFKCKHKLKI